MELDAAEWLVRRDAGLAGNQQKDFVAWLAADPAHGRAFADLEQTWAVLDNVSQLPCGSGSRSAHGRWRTAAVSPLQRFRTRAGPRRGPRPERAHAGARP